MQLSLWPSTCLQIEDCLLLKPLCQPIQGHTDPLWLCVALISHLSLASYDRTTVLPEIFFLFWPYCPSLISIEIILKPWLRRRLTSLPWRWDLGFCPEISHWSQVPRLASRVRGHRRALCVLGPRSSPLRHHDGHRCLWRTVNMSWGHSHPG